MPTQVLSGLVSSSVTPATSGSEPGRLPSVKPTWAIYQDPDPKADDLGGSSVEEHLPSVCKALGVVTTGTGEKEREKHLK